MSVRDYLGSTSFFWSPEEGIVIKSLHPTLAERYSVYLTAERQILEHLGQHRRIVHYLGFHESSPEGIRLAEVNNGTLQTWLDACGNVVAPATRISLCGQLVEALEFIHSRAVIHSDLRPENCLLQKTDAGLGLLLCDFGGSACSALQLDGLGLPDAPFWNLDWKTTPNTDMFAAGSTMYYVMTGYLPFKEHTNTENKSEYEDRANLLIEQGRFPGTQTIRGGRAITACWTEKSCTAKEISELLKRIPTNKEE